MYVQNRPRKTPKKQQKETKEEVIFTSKEDWSEENPYRTSSWPYQLQCPFSNIEKEMKKMRKLSRKWWWGVDRWERLKKVKWFIYFRERHQVERLVCNGQIYRN